MPYSKNIDKYPLAFMDLGTAKMPLRIPCVTSKEAQALMFKVRGFLWAMGLKENEHPAKQAFVRLRVKAEGNVCIVEDRSVSTSEGERALEAALAAQPKVEPPGLPGPEQTPQSIEKQTTTSTATEDAVSKYLGIETKH